MAAGPFTLYNANTDDLRLQDLTGATVKMALVESTYTPNIGTSGDSLWATVSGDEVANGGGYTTGGETLANDAVTAITDGWNYDSDPVSWTASGGGIPAFRYFVMYVSGTLWGKTDPLIGYFLGDSTPADIPATTAGNTVGATPAAGGWFDLTQP